MGLKGVKFTEEHKRNMSRALKGRKPTFGPKGKHWKLSDEAKKNIGNGHRGERNARWRGGITPPNRAMRATPEYKLWRKAVFERDDYTCVFCRKRGDDLHADHIKPFCDYPELRFAIDNGRTLCVPCHRKTPTYGRIKTTKLL